MGTTCPAKITRNGWLEILHNISKEDYQHSENRDLLSRKYIKCQYVTVHMFIWSSMFYLIQDVNFKHFVLHEPAQCSNNIKKEMQFLIVSECKHIIQVIHSCLYIVKSLKTLLLSCQMSQECPSTEVIISYDRLEGHRCQLGCNTYVLM